MPGAPRFASDLVSGGTSVGGRCKQLLNRVLQHERIADPQAVQNPAVLEIFAIDPPPAGGYQSRFMNPVSSNDSDRPLPPAGLAWLVWGAGALFYLYGFFQRVAPAVMTVELMRDFSIGAAALGNLSGFYFYSYVLMQIPTGIVADLWGPRRLLAAGALTAAAGTLLFALAPAVGWAYLGRFLVGGAVAVAWVGLLKIANHWFPPQRFAMVSGLALIVGVAGAVFAGPPLRLLMDHYGWRSLMVVAAVAAGCIAAGIWWVVRDSPGERGYREFDHVSGRGTGPGIAAGIGRVLRYRNTWLLFLIPGGLVGSVLAFAGLWGVPFLVTHYGVSTARASAMTTTLMAAWALSSPFFGWLSDRTGRRKPLYLGGCALALAGWSVLVFVPALPPPLLWALLLTTGLSTGSMIVSFAFAKESVPAPLAGTVSGVVNMGVMLGPMLLQPAIGWMLDRRWEGTLAAGARVYGQGAYRSGFSLMIGWVSLSLVLLVFTRETHCRQR